MILFSHFPKSGLRVPLFLILLWWSTGAASAQPQPAPTFSGSAFTNEHRSAPVAGTSFEVTLPDPLQLQHQVRSASVQVQFDAGEPFTFGNVLFNASLQFQLVPVYRREDNSLEEGTPLCSNCRLTVSGLNPKMLYTETFAVTPNTSSLRLKTISVGPVNVSDSRFDPTQANVIAQDIAAALRASLRYRIEYGIDLRGAGPPQAAVVLGNLRSTLLNRKVSRFQWNAFIDGKETPHVPNYQFQLLRLYNQQDLSETALKESGLLADQQQALREGKAVRTALDWSKALTLETESSNPEAVLTLAEGSGYYAWRVRPVGTLHANGIANALNHGAWSTAETGGRLFLFDTQTSVSNVQAFYYQDPDEDINHLYSRTFTEGNRVSEKITYASPLQQVKQTQAHLPSQGTTAVAQTVYDYNNRPAVTTLPVPVQSANGLDGYRPDFVQPVTPGERPYNAQHFNQPGNTTPVEQQNSDFKYYSGVKDNVPDAEGYPFTRSRYYNDGTNRVREQSGVGKTHMIGPGGRTVKTLYGTATDDELIRLFGDEAPAAESVLKTVTIDQNNTETVTYTSKEGKVIATCLVYRNQETSDGLMPVGDVPPIEITDRITANVREGEALVASKRIVLLGDVATPMNIRYYPTRCPDPTGVGCTQLRINCEYDLRVYLKQVDGGTFSTGIIGNNTDWVLLPNEDDASKSTTLVRTLSFACGATLPEYYDLGQFALPRGTYVVEKYLVAKATAQVEQADEEVNKQMTPLTEMIKRWLATVKCDQDVWGFYTKLNTLATKVTEAKDNPALLQGVSDYYSNLGELPANFFTPEHRVRLSMATGIPTAVYLSSKCCNLKIPLTYMPVFDVNRVEMKAEPADGKSYVNPFLFVKGAGDQTPGPISSRTHFFPDFEGYAYSYFWNCVPFSGTELESQVNQARNDFANKTGRSLPLFSSLMINLGNEEIYAALGIPGRQEAENKLQYIYYKILAPHLLGWEYPGTFNLMVQHMLKDRYSCDGTDANGQPVLEPAPVYTNPCGGQQTNPFCQNGACPQYRLEDIFKCWVAQLNYLRTKQGLCPNDDLPEVSEPESPYKVSKGIDKEPEGGQEKHDGHIDDNIKSTPWIMRWYVKKKVKKVSARIRKIQSPEDFPNDTDGGDIGNDEYVNDFSYNYHVVQEFLNCTGYRFAKILTGQGEEARPTYPTPTGTVDDGEPGVVYKVPADPIITPGWVPYDGKDRKYRPDGNWKVIMNQQNPMGSQVFKYVKDPVYAFKYFEYKTGEYPVLEFSTCFNDPNRGPDGKYLCETVDGIDDDKDLCNFCDYGKVRCDVTRIDWTCGQRYTFYDALNNYQKPEPVTGSNKLLAGDYVSPGYVEEDAGQADQFIDWQTGINRTATYNGLVTNEFKVPETNNTRLQTKVEVDISALNRGVVARIGDAKKAEYAAVLRNFLESRCYQVGGCKTEPNDNVIPQEDFDLLVDLMVEESLKRAQINTFRVSQGQQCRPLELPAGMPTQGGYPTDPAYMSPPLVEYGVVTDQDIANVIGCKQAVLLYRQTVTGNTFDQNTGVVLQADPSFGAQKLTLYDCSGVADPKFEQWRQRREVMEMPLKLVLNLPSWCNGKPATLPDPNYQCPPGTSNQADYANPGTQNNSLVQPGTAPADGPLPPAYLSPATRLDVQMPAQNKVIVNGIERPKQ